MSSGGRAERFDQLRFGHLGSALDLGLARSLFKVALRQLVKALRARAVGATTRPRRPTLLLVGLEAGPERGHKISRLLFLGLRCHVDLFALTLGLDHLAERVAIGVFVLLGLPIAGKVVD